MRVTSAGNVGIGTTSPPQLLTISGDANYIAHYDGSNYAFMLGADSSGDGNFELFDSSGTKVIKIYAEANSSSYINNGGNFGIGTTAPAAQFNVTGTSTIGWSNLANARILAGSVNAGIGIDSNEIVSKGENLYIGTMTSGTDVVMRAGSANSRLQISGTTGYVGIGTNAPSALLHLSSTSPLIYLEDTDATNTYNISQISNASGTLSFDTRRSSDGAFVSTDYQIVKDASGANYQRWFTQNSERMRLTATGKLGIGTTIPTYLLDVADDIGTTRYIRHSGDSDTYFGFSGDNVIQFNVGGDEELYIKSAGDSANYPANIVYTDHNFQVGLDGGKHIGNRINYATSQGWVEDAPPTAAQAGYYGGNFNLNGASTENQLGWGKNPWNARALIWTSINDSSSDSDGGWNKNISGLPGDDYAYMSIIYVKKNGSETSNTGSFYHGCSGSHTLNLDGNANTNPYFQSTSVNNLPDDVWCVSIGIIQANSDANTTISGLIGGIYRLDTGQKVQNATTFKMKDGSTAQTHRTYLYYSTNTNNNLSWYNPGFYVVDGTEPTLAELVYAASATNGSGTTNKISKWLDANTLTDSQLSDDGTNVTSSVPIRILDSVAANNPMLTLYNDTNGGGASIWFSDQITSAAQKGYLTFYHGDSASQGGGATFQFLSTEADMTLQVGGSGKASRVVVWSANSQAEVDYGFADDVNTGMTRLGADQVGLIAGGNQGVYVSSSSVAIKHSGSNKILTSSTGITVTGGVTISGTNSFLIESNSTAATFNLNSGTRGFQFINNNATLLSLASDGYATFASGIQATNTLFSGTVNIAAGIYHIGDTDTFFGFVTGNDTFGVTTGGASRMDANNAGVRFGGAGARIVTVKDEDDMAANSNVALATQQSIKAYVDNSISGATVYKGTWDPSSGTYGNPDLSSASLQVNGQYYICSGNGSATPNGAGTEPNSWHTGDWVIWNDDLGSSGEWQKIDNTSVISGAGTGQKVVKWDGSGTSETIADGPITFSSNDSTFAGTITTAGNVTVNGEITASAANATLNLLCETNGNSTINFADPADNNVGQIIYRHNGNSMSFDTSDTEKMRITSTGFVGIGTDDPKTLLHVVGASGSGSVATVRVGGEGTGNNVSKLELVEHVSGNDMNYGFSFTADGNSTNDLLIKNHDNNITGNVSISIQRGNGYVGINQSSASEPLDVNGTARMDNGIVEGTLYVGSSVQHWGDGGTGMYFNTDEIYFQTASTTALTINSGQDATFQGDVNLTDYQSGTVTTKLPRLQNVVVESNPETKNEFVHPYLLNDLGNFKVRGGTMNFGGLSTDPTTNLNEPFEASAKFLGVQDSVISGTTWTITLLSTGDAAFHLNYGCTVGICFGSTSFAPSSCKIEINDANDGTGTWTTVLDSNQRDTMYVGYTSTGSSGARSIRFTLGKYSTSDPRITNIFAYNYSSQGMTKYFLPLEGGKIYGELNTASNKIVNVGTPTATTDAANKTYVDNAVSSAGSGTFLPLAGGTMTGDVTYNDSIKIKLGTGGGNSDIYHNGTDMYIRNLTTAGDMSFAADSTGSGGAATSYFWLDGGIVKTRFAKEATFADNVKLTFGNVTTPDLQIYHTGLHSYITAQDGTGSLYIRTGSGGTIQLENSAGVDMITAAASEVRLLQNGNEKLATTSAGVAITGQATASEFYVVNNNFGLDTDSNYLQFRGYDGFKFYNTNQGVDQITIDPNGNTYFEGNVGVGDSATNLLGFLESGVNIAAGTSSSTTLQQAGLVISGSSDANDADDFGYLSFTNVQSTLSSDRVAEIRAYKAGSNVDTGKLLFYTANGSSLVEALQINEAQQATFAGSITTNLTSEGTYFTGGSGGIRQLSITSGTNTSAHALHTFNIASSNGKYEFDVNGTTEFSLDSSNATFAGNVEALGLTFSNGGDRSLTGPLNEDLIINARPNDTTEGLHLQINGTDKLFIKQDGSATFAGDVTVAGSGGGTVVFKVDASGDIGLKVDTGNANYLFGDSFAMGTGNFLEQTGGDSFDFKLFDSGTTTTKFQINPASNFTRHKSSVEARFGDSDGLKIQHTGLQAQIFNTIGMLNIKTASQLLVSSSTGENMIKAVNNGAVDLYYDNVKTFSTGSAGVAVTGNLSFMGAGVGSCGTRYITYNCPDDAEYNVIGLTTGGVDIPGTLDVTGIVTLNNNLRLQDSDKLQLGNSQDLEIYHSSGTSKIDNNTGHLYIKNNVDNDDGSNIYIQAKSGENSIICNDDGAVQLYYNNSVKFYTGSSGVGAVGYYGFGSAGTSTGSSYYFRYGSNSAGATQGLIITTSDTGGSYFDGVAQFRNTNTGQGANMFQMINYGALYGRYMNFYRGSTSNIIGYIGYNATNTAVTYSTSSSDIRLKKNIVGWDEEVLPKFLALSPKKFDFKAAIGDKGADKVKGFIAQYEAEKFPEVYQLNGVGQDARYGFHPMEMVPYLMKAVKELAEKNQDLERRLAALEK